MSVRIALIGLFISFYGAVPLAQTSSPPDAPKFTVSRYEVIGENPLSIGATQKVLEPFIGQHEGLEGLQSAADALEQTIRAKGNSFHRVVLPPQTLRDGVVRLQVVEFGLDKVVIENNRYFDASNIRNSLPGLNENESPNIDQLARSLRLANQHPAKQVVLGFKESEKAQAVDAVITVHDRSPHSIFTVLQNTGSDETGDYRLSLGYQYSNLFNRDHAVSMVYTTAPDETDAVSQYGISYRLPVYSISSEFSFAYSDSDIDTGTIDTGEGTGFFNMTGKGTAASLGYRYAIPGSGRYQHDLLVGYDDKLFENDLFFDGQQQATSFNPDLCVENEGRVRTNPLAVSYKGLLRGGNTLFGYTVGFHSNQSGGSYSDNQSYECVRYGATSGWAAARYSMNLSQRIGSGWLLNFRLSGQSAGEPLVPGEQFGLGGAATVRGYAERSILGDDGWQTSLEFWTPAFAKESMQVLVFYDIGHVESEIHTPVLDETGTSVESVEISTAEYDPAGAGLGLRWTWNDQLALRADVASTLKTLENFEDVEKGDITVHFSIYYRF